jgi:hypothetical protein
MGNMAQNANLHPDVGTFAQWYGMPVNVAPPPTTGVTPTFLYNSDSDHPTEGYPIDQSTFIEGGPSAPTTSDRHALVINKNLCKLYEIFNLQNFTNGQTPSGGSGAVWDLSSNAMRPNGFTSADAAGLPITPLLLRPDEIQAGSVAHAIRFTAHCTSTYLWPASHQAGSCTTGFPPMGARFRLRSSYNISSFSPNTQVVLRAFQHYGLVLADNGADWFFGGTTDDWWGTTAGSQVVAELKTIPAAQFDAIDESSIQVAAGSYQAGGPAPCTTPTLTANPPSQQSAGNAVVVTASTSGCVNPQYRFWTRPASGSWTMVQDYGPGNTFNWTSTTPAGAYYIGVHVRAAASTAPYDAVASIPYTLTGTTCASVTETAAPASPQSSGTPVVFTAAASGCTSPLYEFWARWSGYSTWQLLQSYSTKATYSWNSTGAAAGIEYFGVWVKDASSATGGFDANLSIPYSVTTASCTSVTASANPTSVAHGSGTHITITAAATGCTNPNPRYEFWMRPAWVSTWQLVQGYSTSPTYDWNSTGAPAGTIYFGVWAKDASSQTSSFDTNASTAVTVT